MGKRFMGWLKVKGNVHRRSDRINVRFALRVHRSKRHLLSFLTECKDKERAKICWVRPRAKEHCLTTVASGRTAEIVGPIPVERSPIASR